MGGDMTEREGSAWAANRRGDIDRRTLLATAASLAAGAAGATLGLPGRAMAQSEVFKLGWVRPTTGRLVSSFSMLYVGGLIRPRSRRS